MFKKILLAAALSTLALGASAANAGYGIYGYGHHHYYNSYSSYQPSYQPSCYTQPRPVTIRVWDDYSWEFIFKTVYRDYRVCD